MNEEFDLDDIENLLKIQAEKHRMYPSDAVWRNINNGLHGKRRWPSLTFSAILIGAVLTASFIFLHPNKNLFDHPDFIVENNNAKQNRLIVAAKQNHVINNKITGVRALKVADDKSVIYSINQLASPTADQETTIETEAAFNMPVNNNAVVSLNEPVNNAVAQSISAQTKSIPENNTSKTVNVSATVKADKPAVKTTTANAMNVLQSFSPAQSVAATQQQGEEKTIEKAVLLQNTENSKTTEKTIDAAAFPASASPAKPVAKEKIEHPWEISFYATPSISYRTLTLDQSSDFHYNLNPALGGSARNDVNQYVTQSPAVGVGAGTSVSYAISKRFKLTGGLQFNYRQYNFKAYVSSTQQASLLLNRGGYADSLITYSNIRTQGVNAISIGNYYFQLSAPIGFQYTAIQGKKVDILFGANLQPTYQFNKDMYMLTSDFKAYTMEPSLARRWNINTGIEIMARFKAAGLQWEAGPQLRYQMLPTQISNYVIHENLIDYGLKIGIVKQLK